MITTAILLAILAAFVPEQAQVRVQSESSRFTVSVNGVVIGTEEFSVSPNGDGFLARGRTKLRVNGQETEALSTMQLDANLRPVYYEYQSSEQIVRLTVGRDTTEVTTTVDGEARRIDLRFDSGGAIVDGNFFHHYLLLLYRLGENGGTVPALVPQQMALGPLAVRVVGDNTYATDNLRIEATTDDDGRMIRLIIPAVNVVVER